MNKGSLQSGTQDVWEFLELIPAFTKHMIGERAGRAEFALSNTHGRLFISPALGIPLHPSSRYGGIGDVRLQQDHQDGPISGYALWLVERLYLVRRNL